MKTNVLLVDCAPEEVRSFADGLSSQGRPFAIRSHIANWKRTGAVSELRRYGAYFAAGFSAFLHRKEYDYIVGWQQFHALIFCFFCALFHVKKQNVVTALNFTYKEKTGPLAGVYRRFMEKCLSGGYMDHLHVLSESYADEVSRMFSFPRERILVSPFGVDDLYADTASLSAPEGFERGGYALAIGRSNRDYDFLIRAWEEIDLPLVIISDTYKGEAKAEHITLLDNVDVSRSYRWILNCGLMILPIDDPSVCSGDTVLLTAMSMERKIIVTAPSALAEMYITDGDNGLLSEKTVPALGRAVSKALSSPDCADLGARARKSYLDHYSRQSMGRKLSALLRNDP